MRHFFAGLMAALVLGCGSVQAAAVPEPGTVLLEDDDSLVLLSFGQLIALGFDPTSPIPGVSVGFATFEGGPDAVPQAELTLQDSNTDEILYATANRIEHDGSGLISALMSILTDTTGLFGNRILVTLQLDDPVDDPFDPELTLETTGRLLVTAAPVAVIPLPAALPLLLVGVGGLGLVARRRRAAD